MAKSSAKLGKAPTTELWSLSVEYTAVNGDVANT